MEKNGTLTEATYEHLSYSEPAEEAISELSSCAESAMLADFELPVGLVSANVSDFKLSVLPVSVKESKPELSVLSPETINAPHIRPVNPAIAKETISEQSVCLLPVHEFTHKSQDGAGDGSHVACSGKTLQFFVCFICFFCCFTC